MVGNVARTVDYGDDPERLKGVVLEHLQQDHVLYEDSALRTGLVGEVQDTLHHLTVCRAEKEVRGPGRRYLGVGWTATGHEVHATFYFEWAPLQPSFGGVPS